MLQPLRNKFFDDALVNLEILRQYPADKNIIYAII